MRPREGQNGNLKNVLVTDLAGKPVPGGVLYSKRSLGIKTMKTPPEASVIIFSEKLSMPLYVQFFDGGIFVTRGSLFVDEKLSDWTVNEFFGARKRNKVYSIEIFGNLKGVPFRRLFIDMNRQMPIAWTYATIRKSTTAVKVADNECPNHPGVLVTLTKNYALFRQGNDLVYCDNKRTRVFEDYFERMYNVGKIGGYWIPKWFTRNVLMEGLE